jgi:hypothetical protein
VIGAALALSLGLVSSCDDARARLADTSASGRDWAHLEAAIAALPPPIARLAKGAAGDDGNLDTAWAIVRAAVDEGCDDDNDVDPRLATARDDVRALVAGDARFKGVRGGRDLFTAWSERAWKWLASLFESTGMQSYAKGARAVYLSVLALVALVLAARVLRASLRARTRSAPLVVADEVIRARQRSFAVLRGEADAALARGDVRAALLCGQAALRARVGELASTVVLPARTHREILARLAPALADVARPALVAFDVEFYGGLGTVARARAWLADVDAAAAHLDRRSA